MKQIEIKKRSDDWHAQIKSHPEIWGCGVSPAEAVGDMVISHPEVFDINPDID